MISSHVFSRSTLRRVLELPGQRKDCHFKMKRCMDNFQASRDNLSLCHLYPASDSESTSTTEWLKATWLLMCVIWTSRNWVGIPLLCNSKTKYGKKLSADEKFYNLFVLLKSCLTKHKYPTNKMLPCNSLANKSGLHLLACPFTHA